MIMHRAIFYLIAAALPGIAWAQAQVPVAANIGTPPDELSPPVIHHPRVFARRLTGYLPVRDGTQLRYSVLLPKGKGPFPVIVNYSGYDPGSIGGPAYLDDNTAMPTTA
jgi:predicted acyl esterase